MKRLILLTSALLLLFVGCKKHTGETARVRLHVDDFSVTIGDFPSKDSIVPIGDYAEVKGITLAFYEGSDEALRITQLRSDTTTYTTFGDFDFFLPMGSYTMMVLGYGRSANDVFEISGPTSAVYTSDHVRETFAAVQAVNVTNTNDLEISTSLSRVVAGVQVISTDVKTENASTVRTTFPAGGKGFNPTTGLALTNTGFNNVVGAAMPVGQPANAMNFLFLATDEQTMDITLDVLDSDGVSISNKVVPGVPLRRNCLTRLRGKLYDADADGDFTIDIEWMSENDIYF